MEKRGRKDESVVESENWLESDVEKQINLKKKNCWTQHKLIQVSKKSVLPKKKGLKVHYSPEFPINGRFTQGGNVLLVQFSGHTAFMVRVHAQLCTLWHIIFHKYILFHIIIQTLASFINGVLSVFLSKSGCLGIGLVRDNQLSADILVWVLKSFSNWTGLAMIRRSEGRFP